MFRPYEFSVHDGGNMRFQSSILKKEAADSHEKFVSIYKTTCRHIPEDRKLNIRCRENLKSYKYECICNQIWENSVYTYIINKFIPKWLLGE
jgi:hypothetical protein